MVTVHPVFLESEEVRNEFRGRVILGIQDLGEISCNFIIANPCALYEAMKKNLLFSALSLALVGTSIAQLDLRDQGRYWRTLFGLQAWQMDLDHDGDGQSTRSEYFGGTNPFDPVSKLTTRMAQVDEDIALFWQAEQDARYQIFASPSLRNFSPLDDPMTGAGEEAQAIIDPEAGNEPLGPKHFFALGAVAPLDRDGDGLSDREEAILGTNPLDKNTDGDSYDDGDEVFLTFTDPVVFDPAGGTIRGRLHLVESLAGNFESGSPLVGKIVFIDSNFNGKLDPGERRTETDATGLYEFLALRPGFYEVRQILKSGETQTLPAEQTPQLPDRLADEIVDYTHPESGAALDEAYGWAPLEVWPGSEKVIVLGRDVVPVDPSVLLLSIGDRPENPPIGSYATSHHLSLPDTASVTIRFDETIIDKEGPDFIIGIPTQGNGTGTSGS